MEDLSPKEQRELKRIGNLADNPDSGVLKELNKLDDRIDEVDEKADEAISIAKETQKMEGPKGERGDQGEKGDKGDDGEPGEKGDKGDTTIVEKIIERTEVIKEQPIVTEVVKEVAIHESALETAGKLNKEKEIVEQSVIIGLEEEINKLREEIKSKGKGAPGGFRRGKFSTYSLTSQCNGITKAFTLPIKTLSVLGVFGTQFPVQFDPSNDFTFSGRTLTLGASLSAPETGQTLWALIETV